MGRYVYDRGLVQAAARKWQGKKPDEPTFTSDLYAFAEFIGYPKRAHTDTIVDTDNPEVIRIIDLINGPNGHTILKILEIKNAERAKDEGKG